MARTGKLRLLVLSPPTPRRTRRHEGLHRTRRDEQRSAVSVRRSLQRRHGGRQALHRSDGRAGSKSRGSRGLGVPLRRRGERIEVGVRGPFIVPPWAYLSARIVLAW